jgi:tRNA pseudouridine38-40 synthase
LRNFKLTIEYDGTNYHGFQTQDAPKVLPTIQDRLEAALSKITQENIKINGSGRTDAGVHAKGQVVNFLTNSTIPIERIVDALNCTLPLDIVVLKAEEVGLDFHARYSAKRKTYQYFIFNRRIPDAFSFKYSHHIPWKLDLVAMVEAAKYIIGTHDFTTFRARGSSVKDNVRTVIDLNIEQTGPMIKIEITANGFLYNMVRIIVGTLIKVGSGKIQPDDIKTIIAKKDRKLAGLTAPPNGLVLESVEYPSQNIQG